MRELDVLHVYKDYYPVLGGIENHVRTLAEAQAGLGHRVTVLVTNPGRLPAEEMINGVRVVRARRLATVASTPLSVVLPLQLRRLSPDVTHLHFPYPLGEVSQLLLGNGRATVITYHSDVVKQQRILRFYNPLLRRVLDRADRILPTSDRYIESSPYLRPFREKCTAVPLAVDAAPFLNAESMLPNDGTLRLLFVGQHRYYKGVDDLIRALPEIDATLLVGGDGPMRPLWEAEARAVGVMERVRFLGRVSDDDLPRLYASADVFVLPANARAEAFGKVLMEAMATGLPCVTTEVGSGTSFIVQDGITGFVVEKRSPHALAAAINRLLADPELRQRMGKAGQQRVLSAFTVEKMVSNVEAVYRSVLAA